MDWPLALVAELAARRCIIFLGAGASAGCVSADKSSNPPLWKNFLSKLEEAIPGGGERGTIEDLVRKERFLDAAEVILGKIQAADFARIVREAVRCSEIFQVSYTRSCA